MRKIHGVLTALILLCWSVASAQVKEVTGVVTDARDGSPLAKVTVRVKGSAHSTLTGPDGGFKFSVPANATTLLISYVGFNDIEVAIGSNLNISMTPGDKSLSEVVVVGYGTKIKRDITGSVAKIGSRELSNTPATSFESAIQGRAAGVLVEQQNGKLGQAIKVRVRGSSSITGSNEPLYVIDGIPVITSDLSGNGATTNPLSDINTNDIESIEILKDASSAAIYGARGSNGVVLITTKRGKAGKSRVDIGYFTGVQNPTRKMDFLNSEQYVNYILDAAARGGKYDWRVNGPAGGYSSEQEAVDDYVASANTRLRRYSAGNDDYKTYKVYTNWQDEAFQYAPISQYDLSFSGGNDKTTFYMGGQFLDQKGMMIRNSFTRYSGRLNLDHKLNDWLSLGINMNFVRSLNQRISNDNAFSTPLQIVALSPITPVVDPRTGKISGASDPNRASNPGGPNTNYPLYYNPLLSTLGSYYNTYVNRTLGNLYAQIQIMEGLTFRSEFGMDQLNQQEEAYYSPLTERNNGYPRGGGFTNDDKILNITTNNFLRYAKLIGDEHNIDAVAGMSYQEQDATNATGTGEAMPSDAYKKLGSSAIKSAVSSGESKFTFLSYFARANYKFRDRYLLALSGRFDASSRFGRDNRWGFFPAVSAGWILSEENFLKNSKTISFLKLKGSYGLTGNAEIGNYASLGLFSGDGAYGSIPGQRPTQIANPQLKWEKTSSVDVGFEIGFLNNRLSAEVDLYARYTRDLLLNRPVPSTTGFTTQLFNIGKLENRGIEFTINSDNIVSKDFRWSTSVNFGLNRNKITNMGGLEVGTANENRAREGEPLGVFVAREFAGADPNTGDALYVKNIKKSDGTLDKSTTTDYNEAQEVVIGNPNPKFIYGMRNTFTYKTFDLEVLLQGVQGNDIYLSGGIYMSNNASWYDNQTTDQLNAWKKPGDITMVPEARLGFNNGANSSSRYLTKGSYLRVKAVTLGYNLPKTLLSKLKVSTARFYVRAQNLFTITKYKGWDPEVNADYQATNVNQGVDFYSAPHARTLIFGINIGL